MTTTPDQWAKDFNMPAWQAAEIMVRLMKRGLLAAPDGTTPDDHITHLETAYPKPQNVVSKATHTAR
jgi:hypothetical protein